MNQTAESKRGPRVTIPVLRKLKQNAEPIACLTAYDASFAKLVDRAGVDVVLVGDSLGMVVQGRDTTVPVTVDDVIYHTRMVARGLERALLVSDLPFMSYTTPARALDTAARLMQEGGARMVKLEGGAAKVAVVEHLANFDVPVCAHIGLKPQSVNKIGGFKVQGRDPAVAEHMVGEAKTLESAGADIILLECVPNAVGQAIAETVQVPVIGIGAGPSVDGQILVLYDMLGVTLGKTPRFAKNFMTGLDSPLAAIEAYVRAVKDHSYPAPEHCFA